MALPFDYCKIDLGVSLAFEAQREQTYIGPIACKDSLKKGLLWTTGGPVAGGMDVVYAGLRTLGPGVSEDVDLYGVLANVLDEAGVNFALVKALWIEVLSPKDDATHGTLCSGVSFGPSPANGALLFFGHASDRITVPGGTADAEGGLFAWATRSAGGVPVTRDTGDLLRVTNLDGSVAAHYVLAVGGSVGSGLLSLNQGGFLLLNQGGFLLLN